ncbi:MAG: SRPBCC family protein [Pseudomonadota bacterium]
MKLTKLAAYGVGTLAILAAATQALPRHITVERTATIEAAPAAVIAMAASNEGYQRFNPYIDFDPELRLEMFGPASGVGSGFTFDGKDGTGQQVVAAVADDRVTFDLDLGPMGQPVQAISAVPAGNGAQVTWTMDMDLGLNPVARVMGLFMDGMVGPSFEQGLANIADVTA